MNQVRVLLVEDDDDVREVLSRLLELEGHDVTTAVSMAEAVRLVDQSRDGEPYDVALCDYSLPDGNGKELMAALQQRGVKGICLSGYGPEELPDMEKWGFSRHLVKSASIDEINTAVLDVASKVKSD